MPWILIGLAVGGALFLLIGTFCLLMLIKLFGQRGAGWFLIALTVAGFLWIGRYVVNDRGTATIMVIGCLVICRCFYCDLIAGSAK